MPALSPATPATSSRIAVKPLPRPSACPTTSLETCSTFRTPGVIEELVTKAGADRVLFGSDTPLMDPRPQLGKIITAAIDDDAKRLILGENARGLLGL